MGPLGKKGMPSCCWTRTMLCFIYMEERWNIHIRVLPRCSLRCLLAHTGANPHYKSGGLWLQILSLHMGALKTMQMDGKISHWAALDCVHAACKCLKHEAGRSWFLTCYRRAVDRSPRRAAGGCAYFLCCMYYWCRPAVHANGQTCRGYTEKKHQHDTK